MTETIKPRRRKRVKRVAGVKPTRRKRPTDPELMAVRKARVAWDAAEIAYGDKVIAAIEADFSYAQVAEAGLTDKGTLHYWIRRFAKRRGVKLSKHFNPPADV